MGFKFCRVVRKELTKRELDVLYLLGHGSGTKEAAWKLGISPATCERHVSNLMAKLGFHSRYELIIHCAKLGMHQNLKYDPRVVTFKPQIVRAA